MADNLPEPASRKEQYLATIAGMTGIDLPKPASRIEEYLNAIAENGGGGGGGSYVAGDGIKIADDTISVDTTTIQEKLTAGNNITIADDTISATDTTYSNFVGTDGTAAGVAGLVPAPATTDAGKFLKADGTWDTAGGGGPTVVQTTGTSTTDVMSQKATTSMVFADPSTKYNIQIGTGSCTGSYGIMLGNGRVSSAFAMSIGGGNASGKGSVTFGVGAKNVSTQGVVSLELLSDAYGGYNNTVYKLLTGLYDPQNAHDAATKGYVDGLVGNVASALNVINNGTGA